MQDTKLSFEDVDLGDSQETPQTNNQGDQDFFGSISFSYATSSPY
jgi:hypothetical protein